MSVNNSGDLDVSYQHLDEMATRLGNEAKELEESLAAIKQKVNSVAGMWEGESQRAYNDQQAAWDREADGIHQALVAIGHVVNSAGGHYQGGDKKAASYYM